MFKKNKASSGGGQKRNRITERTSEQFAWRSSKLETTSVTRITEAGNIKNESGRLLWLRLARQTINNKP